MDLILQDGYLNINLDYSRDNNRGKEMKRERERERVKPMIVEVMDPKLISSNKYRYPLLNGTCIIIVPTYKRNGW